MKIINGICLISIALISIIEGLYKNYSAAIFLMIVFLGFSILEVLKEILQTLKKQKQCNITFKTDKDISIKQ